MTPKAGVCIYLDSGVYASYVCVKSIHVCMDVCVCVHVYAGQATLAFPSVPDVTCLSLKHPAIWVIPRLISWGVGTACRGLGGCHLQHQHIT